MSLYTFMFAGSSTIDQPWFVEPQTGRTITGREVKIRTDALASGLSTLLALESCTRSVKAGAHLDDGIRDVVAVITPNCLDFGPVVWASHKLGCTVACINGGSTMEEMTYQLSLSGARAIFAHDECLERVIGAARECHILLSHIIAISDGLGCVPPEAKDILTAEELIGMGTEYPYLANHLNPIAFLCFSSGTTGLPKAVVIPHSAVVANVTQLQNASVPTCRVSPGDRALGVVPFSHMFGLLTLIHLCPHLGIATVAFKSMPDFNTLLKTITRLRIGHIFLVPSLVNAFTKHPATAQYDLTLILKSAMIAAAPMDSRTESEFQAIGGPDFLVTQGFGMTECCGLVTGLPFGTSPRPGSVGRVLPFTEAKIVDEYGSSLPPGHRGQLCVRGPQLCRGYLKNEQATRDAFDADGFLLTGDVAEITPDGYVHIVDRLKSMIKNKGYQVSPAELEAHLLSLDVLDDAAVVASPNDRCGEVPVAFVVLSAVGRQQASQDPDAVKEAIKMSVQEAKSSYKWLHDVRFVNNIPRLPSGKIIRHRLKQMLGAAKSVDVSLSQTGPSLTR
ncbi:acetyl-CoA synthetase-like protein [Mycena pura]|uniref:Acetyl-CoA synthetase-like protein n=1 Tax=Mycena pura TaxID=153505 RepID=A0AAD6VDU2_9AGAR|nr:acetyl-CoA synthetase-like protein [Mycena pura]